MQNKVSKILNKQKKKEGQKGEFSNYHKNLP